MKKEKSESQLRRSFIVSILCIIFFIVFMILSHHFLKIEDTYSAKHWNSRVQKQLRNLQLEKRIK
jgi:hypothetical protein